MNLRHFIYLDTEKLYSISSQIFNGFTEEVVSETSSQEATDENQKMGFSKGKTLGHLFTEATKSVEKKFLHDQSFVILEDKLLEEDMLLKLDNTSGTISNELLLSKPFVQITAKVRFDDYASLLDLVSNFNEIGESITYFSNKNLYDAVHDARQQMKQTTDRNAKTRINSELKKVPPLKDLAIQQGLSFKSEFLTHLNRLTKFMYEDEFSFSQTINNKEFFSFINRDYLRESVRLLLRKYQFTSHKELTIVGTISQVEFSNSKQAQDNIDSQDLSIKDAFNQLLIAKKELDSTMMKSNKETDVIIDPIAAYFK